MTFVIQQSYKAIFGFKIDSVWHGIGLMVGCSWCVLECKFARSGFKKNVSVVGYYASRIEGQPVPEQSISGPYVVQIWSQMLQDF